MARIAGIDLPKNKQGAIALTYIYGIGRTTAAKILTSAGIDLTTKVKDWNDEQINGILQYMAANLKVEGELRGACLSTCIYHLGHLPILYLDYVYNRYLQHKEDSIIHTPEFTIVIQ